MKILFLDIDGVLNSREYDLVRDCCGQTNIDPTRLPLVRQIVEKPGACVVLTSSWRVHWNADKAACDNSGAYIDSIFAKYGLRILDKTPELGLHSNRATEIRAWLADHPEVERFPILDDNKFGWAELADYCVFTNPHFGKGLEEEHVERIINILN